jgi:hypothetical protein
MFAKGHYRTHFQIDCGEERAAITEKYISKLTAVRRGQQSLKNKFFMHVSP